jgi:hypothetical protein
MSAAFLPACRHAAPCASKQAKLADFGLHKRVRRLVSSGALVAWNQDTTYRGIEFEPSFYGGNLYLTSTKSAVSAAGSSRDEGSGHGSAGGSMHGSLHGAGGARAALNAASNGTAAAAAEDGSGFGSSSGSVLIGRRRNTSVTDLQSLPEAPHDDDADPAAAASNGAPARPPVYPSSQQQQQVLQEQPSVGPPSVSSPTHVPHSDSATSIQQVAPGALADTQQQQQQQLMSAVRAKSQGLLGKQDFVTRVLSAQPDLLGVSACCVSVVHNLDRTTCYIQAGTDLWRLARVAAPCSECCHDVLWGVGVLVVEHTLLVACTQHQNQPSYILLRNVVSNPGLSTCCNR